MELLKYFYYSIEAFLGKKLFKRLHFLNHYVDEIPSNLKEGILYVEGSKNNPNFAELLCPCGCGDQISINLDSSDNPLWKLGNSFRTDLHPSIWKTKGCKSHFFIKSGKIKWC